VDDVLCALQTPAGLEALARTLEARLLVEEEQNDLINLAALDDRRVSRDRGREEA
jgi:hypothetical protein